MIGLVTQFDEPEARPTVATPTCCCCCCCVASAASATVFSSMHLRSLELRAAPEATAVGRTWPPVVGALALWVGLGIGAAAALVHENVTVFLVGGLAAWLLVLFVAYRAVGAPHALMPAAVTVAVASAAIGIELLVGAILVLWTAGIAYLVAAPLAIWGTIRLFRRRLG